MDHARQVELVRRILRERDTGRRSPSAEAAYHHPVADYTDEAQHALELDLFRSSPLLAGLRDDAREPGSYFTLEAAGTPLLVLRDGDGTLRAFLNTCRHRGAPVASGRGSLRRRIVCPYHGWSYGLDGHLVATSEPWAFAGVDPSERGLVAVPVAERHGLIFLRAAPGEAIDVDAFLAGAERELAPFGLGAYHRFAHTELRQRMNWKMVMDTFMEQYHLPVLHRETLAPMFLGALALFDAFGDHGRLVAVRRSIQELEARPECEWSLLPHTTLLYFLFPNVVFIHQQDHIQSWQVFPDGGPDEARMAVTLYTPTPPASEKARRHFERHMEILIDVTTGEDFQLGERIQRGYRAGTQENVVFGRNEVGLAHYHRTLRRRIGLAPGPMARGGEACT